MVFLHVLNKRYNYLVNFKKMHIQYARWGKLLFFLNFRLKPNIPIILMNNIVKSFLLVTVAVAAGWSCGSNATGNPSENNLETIGENMEKEKLRHVVLFKFKEESSAEDVKMVEDAFAALADKIPLIKDFEWGTNNSPEGLDKGLTHCFLVTFESEEDRDAYLPHPEHQAFVEVLKPHLADVTVVDYWAK